MQPIIYSRTVEYAWERVTKGLSLKNSHMCNGGEVMLATDMERGGIVALQKGPDGIFETLIAHWFPGRMLLWAPYAFNHEGRTYVLVCDGVDALPNVWWEYMQIYAFEVYEDKTTGPFQHINLPNPDNIGFIDPSILRIGRWWYMFVADLWNSEDGNWWSPRCFVAETPFGPFTAERSFRMEVPERGIDEAFKPFCGANGELLCTYSSGDSGIDGCCYLGRLESTAIAGEGWHYFTVKETACLKAVDSDLCTALDPGMWPTVHATLREPGGEPGGRDKFYIGRLI